MILKLLTVKEYCKISKITDAAARKKIKNNSVKHCIFNDQTYIVIEDTTQENQENKIKLFNSNFFNSSFLL